MIADGYRLKMKSCGEIIPNLIKYAFIAMGTKCITGGAMPDHIHSNNTHKYLVLCSVILCSCRYLERAT